ncbi:hypothetical protein [Amycolatopsis sp. NBC_00438]|uniref:hypothetical protein n=1 Tax=Amycolatopsis sp. NBC_00438 TaxID=2903558 RepID=UPI002E1AF048
MTGLTVRSSAPDGDPADTLTGLKVVQLRSLVEPGVDKNTTAEFPAPLMSTIGELGSFLAREAAAAVPVVKPAANGEAVAKRT